MDKLEVTNDLPLHPFSGQKGRIAQLCLQSWDDYKVLRDLKDPQAIAFARLMCKGEYAKTWAMALPEASEMTWKAFCESFREEFCEECCTDLWRSLLDIKQGDLSVGEYATRMRRLFQALRVPGAQQVHLFLSGLNVSLRIVASNAENFEDAVKKAKKSEDSFRPAPLLPSSTFPNQTTFLRSSGAKNQEPQRFPTDQFLGTASFGQAMLTELEKEAGTARPRLEKRKVKGTSPNHLCPRCLLSGHTLRHCESQLSEAPFYPCCKYYGRHRKACKSKSESR